MVNDTARLARRTIYRNDARISAPIWPDLPKQLSVGKRKGFSMIDTAHSDISLIQATNSRDLGQPQSVPPNHCVYSVEISA